MTTGQLIKAARKEAGLTQAELATKLNVPYQSISQWERGTRSPKIETLERIADALGVPISKICSKDVLKNYDILKRQKDSHKEFQNLMDGLNQYALALRQQEAIKVLGGEYIEKFVFALNDLNMDGRWRVVNHAVDYAHDLAKIPEYQWEQPETAPQSPSYPQEGTATPIPNAPETAPESQKNITETDLNTK